MMEAAPPRRVEDVRDTEALLIAAPSVLISVAESDGFRLTGLTGRFQLSKQVSLVEVLSLLEAWSLTGRLYATLACSLR